MNVASLFRIRTSLTEDKKEYVERINLQTKFLSDQAVSGQFLETITSLLYDAHTIDPTKTISEVLFGFAATEKKTNHKREYLHYELISVSSLADLQLQKIKLIEIYRDLVASIFDPYLSLIVACLQIKEGSFQSFILANLAQGERNKYEYAFSRLKPTTLFDGYDPIVRNAVSHTGSESIIFTDELIIFRNIKRGNPPIVEYVKWTVNDLKNKIILLQDFACAAEIAINIFGLDIGDEIHKNKKLADDFFTDVLAKEDRLHLQEGFNSFITKIVEQITDPLKVYDVISKIYFIECAKRDIAVLGTQFNSTQKQLGIKIPAEDYDSQNEDSLVSRILIMARYAIIAEPCFGHSFDQFIISEDQLPEKNFLIVILEKQDLADYGREQAGLLDLLHTCRAYLNGELLDIIIDFEKYTELSLLSFEKTFPKRNK